MADFHWISMLLFLSITVVVSAEDCKTIEDCTGFKTECVNGSCQCPHNFTLHSNAHDCQQVSCHIEDCLLCDTSNASLCYKCEYFLSEDRTRCLQECPGGTAVFDLTHETFQGPKCTPDMDPSPPMSTGISTDVVIGVVAGVSGALLICIVVLIGYCIHIRRTRRNVNLNETHYSVGNMQAGNVKKVPMYDNQGFDQDHEPSLVHNLIDRDVYLQELEKLRPHAQTLLTMLNDIRHKLRAMDKSDTRVPTYKGVIHQLCRVLVLIHKKDPGASIPSDALGLMEWAHQMIEDKQSDVEPAEESMESNPVNKISYIEVPPTHSNPYATPVIKKPNSYATLNKRNSQLNVSTLTNSFYSSVPVPVDYDHTDTHPTNHVSVSQTNTLKSTSKENLKRQYEIPWDRKIGDSFSTLNCSGSDLTMGYFANGRYYDPTPRQQTVIQDPNPEIYAPVSSYSDRSNPPVFSTFTGGIARNQSMCSQTSSDSNTRGDDILEAAAEDDDLDDDDDDINDGEGFPFNINDATDPVEV